MEWCSKNDSLIHGKDWHAKGGKQTWKLHPENLKKANETTKIKLPINELRQLYEEGKTKKEIAILYGVGIYVITRMLKENNVKIRGSKENYVFVKEKIEKGKKKWFKEHSKEASETGKRNFERNLKKSGLIKGEYQRYLANKCFKKYGKEHYKKMALIGGPASAKANRDKKPYIFLNCKFDSKQEMEVAKMFFEEFGYFPLEGINCHVKIGGKEFDFFLDNLFIEWHPWDRNITFDEYYNKRIRILKDNSYPNGLIVFDKLNNVKDFCEVVKNSNNL